MFSVSTLANLNDTEGNKSELKDLVKRKMGFRTMSSVTLESFRLQWLGYMKLLNLLKPHLAY